MHSEIHEVVKHDKQTAYDAALARGAKLGIKEWVVPRERVELGSK